MDIILKNKYKISLNTTGSTLKESIDSIAYTLELSLIKDKELVKIGLCKGDSIKLYDYTFETHKYIKMFDGIVWDCDASDKERTISITAKERTVYMEESEDEYLFSGGRTATQRAKEICNDWGIPLGDFPDTGVGLAKDRKKSTLYSIMREDLRETAQKGGYMYRYRMEEKLNLVKIGNNSIVYKLDSILEDSKRKQSLSGAVTQVKVQGKNENDDTKTPILGTFKGDATFGTFQKIAQDEKVTDYSSAKEKANTMFTTGDDTWTFTCVKDISDIRAGDKVQVGKRTFYVTNISHVLGSGASMSITAVEDIELIRSKYYA